MSLAMFLLVALGLSAASCSVGWRRPGNQEPWLAPEEARREKNPVPANAYSVAEGQRLYRNYCLSCHGERGGGDGPWVANLPEPPRSLADPNRMRGITDGELFWKISEGREPMPGYRRTLRDVERWHLVNYLRTLPAPADASKP